MVVLRKDQGIIRHTSSEYGRTELGTPLKIYVPTDKTELDVLILAGIHGDEPEGTVLLSEALRSLESTELINAVILCANPDGMANGTRANANGVDLNRNFPASNWSSESIYYRYNNDEIRDIELSPGQSPNSESETQSLVNIINKLQPKHIISLHAPLACIEDPKQTFLSKMIAENTGLPLVKDVGYFTPGSMGSWAADVNIPIITFELPSNSIAEMRKKLFPTLIELLANNCEF